LCSDLSGRYPKIDQPKRVSFVASDKCLRLLLCTLQPASSRIRELNLTYVKQNPVSAHPLMEISFTDRSGDLDLPAFDNLTEISYSVADDPGDVPWLAYHLRQAE
jgi:hypothetical protein